MAQQNPKSTLAINLLLVDDHTIVTDGISALLANDDEFIIKGVADNGAMALEMLRVLRVDVVLLDIDMPVMNGIDASQRILKEFPDVKIIMLTMHDEKAIIQMMVGLGVHGYLLKNSPKSELTASISSVIEGNTFLSEHAGSVLLSPDISGNVNASNQNLTEREIEIIRLIAEGLSNKEIGEKLFISHRTVDTHRTNLMTKLGVHNVAGIVKYAILNGFTED